MLRLTKKADYSLIALKHFAARQRQSGDAVSAKEVSDCLRHCASCAFQASAEAWKGRFSLSEHGTNGGYRLARDPALISALEVIRAIDGPVVLANCFTDTLRCDHSTGAR